MSASLKAEAVADGADAFLALLAGDEAVTFQTFGEGSASGRAGLSRVLHGTLAQHRAALAGLNARGAGVFWMPNAGNGKGRKTENVQRIRALFVDLDGAPLEPVQTAPLRPHAIVQSSPGRWHAYWRIVDCPPPRFSDLQKALAAHFGGDAKVCDLPRVMRLPGFMHRKGEPYPSGLIALLDQPPYALAEVVDAFGLRAPEATPRAETVTQIRSRKLPEQIPEGERDNTLLRLAAGFVRLGHGEHDVNKRLRRINAERCIPPLSDSQVHGIAAQACRYGSSGFSIALHALEDSTEWNSLLPTGRDVIRKAFRRFNGHNNGNISLTETDFKGIGGFGSNNTFRKALAEALASGILVRVSKARNTQKGRKPALYAIAQKWLRQVQKLHVAPSAETACCPKCRNCMPK